MDSSDLFEVSPDITKKIADGNFGALLREDLFTCGHDKDAQTARVKTMRRIFHESLHENQLDNQEPSESNRPSIAFACFPESAEG